MLFLIFQTFFYKYTALAHISHPYSSAIPRIRST